MTRHFVNTYEKIDILDVNEMVVDETIVDETVVDETVVDETSKYRLKVSELRSVEKPILSEDLNILVG